MTFTTLTLVDGVRIVVPDSLDLATPYVLREQGDWFEDEIRFLRRLLRPGQRVVDIGANHGVYTLCLAKVVGPSGRVWAFEPASETARILAQSITQNGFGQVVLDRSALSAVDGTATLSLHGDSELNALVRDGSTPAAGETVPVVTLDRCIDRYRWRDIDFVKIDAEGEEVNIVRGGPRFFSAFSPLVQFEYRLGNAVNAELVAALARLGYGLYRLVPGLGLMAPVSAGEPIDPYQLNLFACKADRAATLAADGFLVEAAAGPVAGLPAMDAGGGAGRWGWRETIGRMPYGRLFSAQWERTMGAAGGRQELAEALAFHAVSADATVSPAGRLEALRRSFRALQRLCATAPTGLRRVSLARVARELGEREIARTALLSQFDHVQRTGSVDASEPFLAVDARFEAIDPAGQFEGWLMGGLMEAYERASAFSSFYLGQDSKGLLENIVACGFASDEMVRRLALVRARFGLTD